MATVILQARTGSTRLPGKALKTILGKPMLQYTVETLKLSPVVDRIVMATPENSRDDILGELAAQWGIHWFRGSESDVLDRTYRAALRFKDDYYFRATGDNPIIDYQNPERILSYLKEHQLDYVSETGLPLGCVLEVFTFEALERAYHEGTSPEDREHVTWYIKKSGRFKIKYIKGPPELRMPGLRLTVDYPEDFQRVAYIIENLYQHSIPRFKDIIDFCQGSSF